jgi:hypothetical protein
MHPFNPICLLRHLDLASQFNAFSVVLNTLFFFLPVSRSITLNATDLKKTSPILQSYPDFFIKSPVIAFPFLPIIPPPDVPSPATGLLFAFQGLFFDRLTVQD